MIWVFIIFYVLPVVIIWGAFLIDKLRGLETTAQGGDADLISMLFNVGSFVPVINIILAKQILDIIWKNVKETYFRDEL